VYKPAGISSTKDLTHGLSLLEVLEEKLKIPFLQPVHRLDKPIEGVIVFVKDKTSFTHITEQFKAKTIDKTYLAVVRHVDLIGPKILHHYLRFQPNIKRSVIDVKSFENAEEVMLTVEKVSDFGIFSLIKLLPHTGKTHQIRVQLGYENMPIVGDVKYGYRRNMKDKSIALLAKDISFNHPVSGKRLTISCEIPTHGIWSNMHAAQG
jgi:23S rRNA pseudouridine1911/1915/1917 synthase